MRGTYSRQDEHARPDDAANPKEGQINGAQRAVHPAVFTLCTEVFQCFLLKKHKNHTSKRFLDK